MDLKRNKLPLGQRPALILVDMINGFTDPACPLGSSCESVIDANNQLLDEFRRRALPVFFTTVVYRSPQQARVFRARIEALNCLLPNSHWVAVDQRLHRRASEPLIEKQWASAFFRTDLDRQLRARRADCLVVTGLTTSGCVRATVVDGLQHEFPVFVPEQAVGDRNPAAHAANLFDMNAKYADIVQLDEVLREL